MVLFFICIFLAPTVIFPLRSSNSSVGRTSKIVLVVVVKIIITITTIINIFILLLLLLLLLQYTNAYTYKK